MRFSLSQNNKKTYTLTQVSSVLDGVLSTFTATAISDSQINLAWTTASTNELSYLIQRSTDGVNYSDLSTVASGTLAYSDTSLTGDTTYYYRIRANRFNNHSSYLYDDATTFDMAAQDFIDATGITDATLVSAVVDIVKDIKDAGLWTKAKAIYPLIGGTATTNKYNLVDPRDLDAAFRITWSGSLTHSSLGVKGDGASGYGNTHLDINTHLAYNNVCLSVYSRDETNSQSGFELATNHAVNYCVGVYRSTGCGLIAGSTYAALTLAQINRSDGLFTVSRVSNVLSYKMRNGTVIATATNEITDQTDTSPLFVCARNNNGTPSDYSNRQISFIWIGEGLTPHEEMVKYAIIRKFINAIDGNSTYNNNILFESWQSSSISQVALDVKINTGHSIIVDWGEGDAVEYTGDGSVQTLTSIYTIASTTKKCRISGELDELIYFSINAGTTIRALNYSDFRRLSVPLYYLSAKGTISCLFDLDYLPLGLTILKTMLPAYYGYGSADNIPVYLINWEHTNPAGFTMDGLTNLPETITHLNFSAYHAGDIDIDNLPSSLISLILASCSPVTGSLNNLPASLEYISIIDCGTSVDITTGPFKAWAETDIYLNCAYPAASVDGFFNTYVLIAGAGAATLDLAGTGTGKANDADTVASAVAQATLTGLGKTILTN